MGSGARATFVRLLLCGVSAMPARAVAQASPSSEERTFTLEYAAPEGCPGQKAFVAAVQARTAGSTYLPEGRAELHFRVRLLEGGSSTLWVDLPDGSSRRQFEEPSCHDAVESIAVIASMVLEAAPSQRLLATEHRPEVSASRADFPETANTAPTPAPGSVAVEARPDATPGVSAKGGRADEGFSLAVAAGSAVESAIAPTPPLAVTAGLEVLWATSGAWAPRLRAEALLSREAVESSSQGDGAFQLCSGRLSGCVLPLELGPRVRALPCMTFDVGSLRARGGGAIDNRQTRYMPWVAGGLSARLEVQLAPWVALEAAASVRRLARRDRFIFRPESLVYQVPAWSAGLGLGLLLRFHGAEGSITARRDIAFAGPP